MGRAIIAFAALATIFFAAHAESSHITQPVNWGAPGAIGATTPNSGAFTTLSASGQITSTLASGTPPFVIASTDAVANLRASRHSLIQFCGTTAACAGTAQTAAQLVYGSVALTSGSPSTATITGISPAFSSNTSYKCALSNETAAANNLLSISYVSGSSFTITGPNTITDVIGYVCIGT